MPEEPKPPAPAPEPLTFAKFIPVKPLKTRTKEGSKHGDVLKALTMNLVDTYANCSQDFKYTLQLAPRRVLTKLSKGVHNNGHDNSEHDYICRVCDKIVNPDGDTYEILERLGHGTFGQVLKCVVKCVAPSSDGNSHAIALKIIKNKPAYFHQALVEVHILKMLNTKYDPEDTQRIVRMVDFFVYRKHLCIAFELLSVNLYDVLKQNSFRGVSMALIRVLTEQLLKAMQCLRQASVIHCDLKPENVLLSNMQHTRIKLIDFGSACFENHTVYSYIQSRFYRSPEVLLGLPYTTAIDMWSLGCICAELFLGLPIFPGHSEYDQVCRIAEVCGLPPAHMLEPGKCTRKYFRRVEEPRRVCEGDDDSGSDTDVSVDSVDEQRIAQERVAYMEKRLYEALERASFDMGVTKGTDDTYMFGDHCAVVELTSKNEVVAGLVGSNERIPIDKFIRRIRLARADKSAQSPRTDEDERQESVGPDGPEEPEKEKEKEADEQPKGSGDEQPKAEDQPEEKPAADDQPTEEVEQPPVDTAAASTRNESFLDLLKRKVGIIQPDQPAPATSDQPTPATSAPAPPSDSGSAGGGTALSENDGVGSAASTAAEATEGKARAPSGESSQAARRPTIGDVVVIKATDNTIEHFNAGIGRRYVIETDSTRHEGFPYQIQGHQVWFQEIDVRLEGGPVRDGSSEGRGEGPQTRRRLRRRRVRTYWRLKTRDEYERDEHKKEPTPKKYFDFKSLEQMVEQLPYKSNMSRRARSEEAERRHCFLQFLWGVLHINPDERWTPKQAAHQSFITGAPFDPTFTPCNDQPVPSFTRMLRGHPPASSTLNVATGTGRGVPKLDPQALGQGQGAGFSGGGSARSYKENSKEDADGQPRSAPSTFRGAQPASGEKKEGVPVQEQQATLPVPEDAVRGLWGHLCAGVPLPDENPAESYRPPIDQLSEDFFKGRAADTAKRRSGGGQAAAGSPQKSGTMSSASSTGSTSRRNRAAPLTGSGSPLTTGQRRPRQPNSPADPSTILAQHTPKAPGPTGTPASHGSASPHSVAPTGPISGTPVSNAQTPQGGVPHTAPGAHQRTACTSGSRDGSRGSSPWHLPSPMSELSTASDRVNSSQPSGSDSCGENLMHGTHFNEWSGEDPSHSDGHWPRSHQPSDSDGGTMTPQSDHTHGTAGDGPEKGAAKDPRDALWENIKAEMARVELSRDKLPRRLDITQSPGSAGAMGNFREKMGMNESGPVIPFGHGARRDGAGTGTAAGISGVFTPPHRPTQSAGSGQGADSRSGRRLKKPSSGGSGEMSTGSGNPGSSANPGSGGSGGGSSAGR